MATFVLLARFTHQGITDVKRTVERAEAFRQMAGKVGVTVKDIYWTLGSRDVVVICEAADDEVVTALSLSLASRGNISTETLRAFSSEEMKRIVSKIV